VRLGGARSSEHRRHRCRDKNRRRRRRRRDTHRYRQGAVFFLVRAAVEGVGEGQRHRTSGSVGRADCHSCTFINDILIKR